MSGPRCSVCGYRLEGMPAGADRCPECGSNLRQAGESGGFGPSASDRGRLCSGVELAWVGLLAFVALPPIGAALDTAGWWRVSRSIAPGAKRLPMFARSRLWWIGLATRALSLATVGLTLLATGAAAHVLIRGRTVWSSAADETAIALLIATVPVVWSVRHVLAMVLIVSIADGLGRGDLRRGAVASAAGGVAMTGSGFVLIGLGVLVFHVALFPPLCFVLPAWIGAAAIWLAATLALLARLRTALGGTQARGSGGAHRGATGSSAGGLGRYT